MITFSIWAGTRCSQCNCSRRSKKHSIEICRWRPCFRRRRSSSSRRGCAKKAGLSRRARKWQSHLTNLRQLSLTEKLQYIMTKLRFAPAKAKHKIYRRAYKLYRQFGKPLPPVLQNIEEINFAAVKDYEPQVYAGDVTLFLATDLTADYDSKDVWRELVQGQIETYEIPGNHLNMIKEPGVCVLAERLRVSLERAESQRSPVRD